MGARLRERADVMRTLHMPPPTVGCVRDHIDELRAAIDLPPFAWPFYAPCDSITCASHAPTRELEPYVFRTSEDDDWDSLSTGGKIAFTTIVSILLAMLIALGILMGQLVFSLAGKALDTGISDAQVDFKYSDEERLNMDRAAHNYRMQTEIMVNSDGTWYTVPRTR